MDHVVVILVHYNTEEVTRNCLASLRASKTTRDFQLSVLVVDNASKEVFNLKQHEQTRRVHLVRSEANLGFTGGNNLGIWYAREHLQPTHILLLNTDTTIHPDAIKHLYQVVASDTSVGAVSPKIYFSKGHEYHLSDYSTADKGNVLWYAGGSIDWQNLVAFHRGVDEVDRGHYDLKTDTEFCTGCCLMVPLNVIEKVGSLDKKYFLYLEDTDWSLRIQAAGFNLRFCPQAEVWHDNAGSSGGSGSTLHQYYQTRNRLFFGFRFGDWKVKVVAVRLALNWVLRGSSTERRAVFDWILGKMGKQAIA